MLIQNDVASTCLNALGHVGLNDGVALAAREEHSPDTCDCQAVD